MTGFVQLGATAADLIMAASDVKTAGDTMTSQMSGAVSSIRELDVASTFPHDRFTEEFLKTYHQPIPSGTDDGEMEANRAILRNAETLGPGLQNLGGRAVDAMWAYTATDDDNATDIGNAAGA